MLIILEVNLAFNKYKVNIGFEVIMSNGVANRGRI